MVRAWTCLLIGLLAGFAWLAAAPAAQADTLETARAALALSASGDHTQAIALSQSLVREETADGTAWRVRAYILSQAGHSDLALTAYEEAIQLDGQDVIALNNAARLMIEAGRAQEALLRIRQVLTLAPRYADARNNRGVALEHLGRLQDAEYAYRGALMVNPRHARAINNLGALRLRRGQPDEARADFERALALDPTLEEARLNVARSQDHNRLDAGYVQSLETRAAAHPHDAGAQVQALAARAAQQASTGALEAARATLLRALEADPRNPALLNNLGVVQDQLGNDRDAMLRFQEAAALDPSLHVVRNNVGIVHVHRGALDLARGVFESLIRDAPRFHRAHYNLGVLHAAQGDVLRALQSLRRARALAPNDPHTIYNLGLVRRRMGAPPRVEHHYYRRALGIDPGLAEAHLGMGTLLASPETPAALRNPSQARTHLRRFLELARPNDAKGREQAASWLRWLNASQSRVLGSTRG